MAKDFEVTVLSELASIKSTAAATAEKVSSLENRLFDGPSSVIEALQNDIVEIKKDRESDKNWNRVHNILHYSIGPVLVALHEIARKMGVPI